MSPATDPFESLPVKLIAALVVAVCLIVGIAGLVLPLVPGLVFLAVAGVVAARYSPKLDGLLRGNATVARYLDEADALTTLPIGQKVRLACLLFVRALIDGVAVLISSVARIVRSAARA
jgi:uncharacterized membrane protein YbaN (DUF454 family)